MSDHTRSLHYMAVNVPEGRLSHCHFSCGCNLFSLREDRDLLIPLPVSIPQAVLHGDGNHHDKLYWFHEPDLSFILETSVFRDGRGLLMFPHRQAQGGISSRPGTACSSPIIQVAGLLPSSNFLLALIWVHQRDIQVAMLCI